MTRAILLAILTLIAQPLPAAAEQVPPSLQIELERARAIVETWANEFHAFVEPTLINDVAGSLIQFQSNFCADSTRQQCAAILEPGELRNIVLPYLNDTLENDQATIRPLPARLAEAVGNNISVTGWRDVPVLNLYAIVDLPTVPAGGHLFYVHWDGVEAIPTDILKAVLSIGRHTFLRTSDAGSYTFDVEVSLASRGEKRVRTGTLTATQGNSPDGVAAGKILPDYSRYALEISPDPNDPRQQSSAGRGGTPVSKASPFRQAQVAKIELLGGDGVCDVGCRAKVADAIVEALVVWRAGCTRCDPKTLEMVEVEGRRYLETSVVDWLEFSGAQGLWAAAFSERLAAWIGLNLSDAGPLSTRHGFERVEDQDAVAQLACAGSPPSGISLGPLPFGRGYLPSVSRELLDRVCHPTSDCDPSNNCFEVKIDLDGAGCGLFVACGHPDASVGFNVQQFAFRLARGRSSDNPEQIMFGRGDPRHTLFAAPVAIHEIGHWFGVEHIEQELPASNGCFNVMKPDMSQSDNACLTQGDLIAMDNALDQDWDYRLVTQEGLRYKPNVP